MSHQVTQVYREDYFRGSSVRNLAARLAKFAARCSEAIWSQGWFGVNAFNNLETRLPDAGHDADRAQQSRRVVDQIKECRKAKHAETGRNKNNKLKDGPLHPVIRAYGEQQREDEEPGRISNDIVPHQHGSNYPRSQLS